MKRRFLKVKLALLVANRGFFPSTVIESAREEMLQAAKNAGVELLIMDNSLTKYGAVETREEGEKYAEFLAEHYGEYDGLILCLPNFGDENGIKEAIKDVKVPILLQAYPDEIGKMDFADRRDAFAGKLGLCAVLKQMKVPFVSGEPFVMHPLSVQFQKELADFVAICRMVKRMSHMRIGVLGARTTAFKSVRFDEAAMESRGVDVETLDMTQIFAKMEAIADEDSRIADWKTELENISDTSDTPAYAILNQCKLGIALEELQQEMKLDVMAIRCWSELQYEYKITPCTVMGILNKRQIPVVCETDATNAPAMLALTLASETGVGCLDVNNNYGTDPDKCILFHCGPLPIDLLEKPGHMEEHKMFTKTQGENCSWGVNVGKIKPGTITVCGMRTEDGETRYFVEKAEVVEAEVDEGFFGTYGVIEMSGLQTKLRHMAEEGFRHHAMITAGDHTRRVREALSKYLGYTEVKL
jgi:L-fucose isomerase-like protein